MKNETDFTLKRYSNIDDVVLAHVRAEDQNEALTLEELQEITFGGLAEGEDDQEFTYQDKKEGISLMGYWGWIDSDKVIHYWIDENKNIPFEELVHFFAHEIGHRTGTELEDDFQEEMRAEEYGYVATLAYKFAKQHTI